MIKTYSQFNESVESVIGKFKKDLIEEMKTTLNPVIDFINEINDLLDLRIGDEGFDFYLSNSDISLSKPPYYHISFNYEDDDFDLNFDGILDSVDNKLEDLSKIFDDIKEHDIILTYELDNNGHGLYGDEYTNLKLEIENRFRCKVHDRYEGEEVSEFEIKFKIKDIP
jgi:hypothetical protein